MCLQKVVLTEQEVHSLQGPHYHLPGVDSLALTQLPCSTLLQWRYAMTQPKMVHCKGSGQEVDGPDEQDGTVQCRECGTSGLKMVTTVVHGKKRCFVPEHKCRARPFRRIGVKIALSYQRMSRRDTGRHR